MKAKIHNSIKYGLLLLLFVSVYVNFLTFKSLVGQFDLAKDVGKFEYTPEEVDEMLPAIPNVTAVIIPINVTKAMYLIKYNRLLEAVKLIEAADKAQPYTKVGEYLKSRVFIANGVMDSALSNAKRAFYGWPKNINHYATYNEVLIFNKDTLEILNAYKSLDSSLAVKNEYKKVFSESYNQAKFAYLITDFPDSRTIDKYEIQGHWVRGYNFPNNKFIQDNNYTFNFEENLVTNNLGETYKYSIKEDSLNFYFNNSKGRKIMTFGIRYSDSLSTLILKGIKLNDGTIQDQFYKKIE
mgnify:CR=1 FL=1